MNSTKLMVVIAGLQVVTLAGQWLGQPSLVSPAQAQLADPGAQRIEMIAQLKSVNEKLDKLCGILESGNLQVKTVAADEKETHRPAR